MATRRTTGVEALFRWHHPTEGLLQPAQVMPEAERSELIEQSKVDRSFVITWRPSRATR